VGDRSVGKKKTEKEEHTTGTGAVRGNRTRKKGRGAENEMPPTKKRRVGAIRARGRRGGKKGHNNVIHYLVGGYRKISENRSTEGTPGRCRFSQEEWTSERNNNGGKEGRAGGTKRHTC